MTSIRESAPHRPNVSAVRAVWIGGGLAALALGAAVAFDPKLLGLGVVAAFGAGVVLLAFVEPRWVVAAQIFLLSSYAIYVLPIRPATPDSLVLLALLGVGLRRLLLIDTPRWPEVEMMLVGALLFVMLASSVGAGDPAASGEAIASLIRNGLLVLLIVTVVDSARWLGMAMWAFVVGAAGMAGLNVLQRLSGSYDSTFLGFAGVEYDRGLIRSAGPLSSNFFAQMLVATAVLAVYLGFAARNRVLRVLAFLSAATSVLAIALSYSRASLLVVFAIAPAIAILRGVRPTVVATSMSLILLVSVAILLPSSAAFRDGVHDLYESVTSGEPASDVSVSGRLSEQIAAAQMFADYPLLGVGAGNYPSRYLEYSDEIGLDPRAEARSPHNLYLEALANTGAVGAAVFLALLWVGLSGSWRARRALKPEAALLAEGCCVALAGFLLNAIFLHMAYDSYFWMVVALALAARGIGQAAGRVEGSRLAEDRRRAR